jgi:hypothetical protein
MRRVGAVSAALCLLPGLLLVGPADAGAASSMGPRAHGVQAEDQDPLELSLQSLTPSVLPRRGPVQLSGLVINRSDETWTDLKIYPWRSTVPITTVPDLGVAAETDPALSVGTRIIDTYEVIDSLAPGGIATYHLTVPRGLLGIDTGTSGVYWIGAQVLATNSDGRDEFADGRVRTFIPQVRGRPDPIEASLVVPIRHDVVYARNGSLRDVPGWLSALQPGGQLRNLIQFVDTSPTSGVTLLIDPAVIEAIHRLADGNPVRDLGPADVDTGEPSESPSPTAEATFGRIAPTDSSLLDTAARWAAEWLALFDQARVGRPLLALPYADLDVDAAAQLDPSVLDRALAMTQSSLKELGLTAATVVAPPSGYVSPATLASLPANLRVLVSSEVLAKHSPDPADDPTELSVNGHPLRVIEAAASAGGPGPGNTRSALQIRQRLLAETALRALGGATNPVILSLPIEWNPGLTTTDFFPGIDEDWLTLTPEPVAGSSIPSSWPADQLVYPERIRARELTRPNFEAADQLLRDGVTLQNVLTASTDVAREVAVQALSTVSFASRDDPTQAVADADGASRAITRNFAGIRIEAPPYVTLSSATGRFRIDLSNDLDQAVTVRIEALTDSALTIEAPSKVKLKGQSSTTVLLNARSTRLGVHQVTLVVTDVDGTGLGPSDSLPIRANEVGRLIWLIMAGGASLLFGAIAVRLFRRFRRWRAARRAEAA